MSQQKSINFKSLIPWFLATGFAWSLGFIYNVYYGGELSWLRRMYFQKIAIAESTTATPRLLITGGSGAHYTIDSDLIEQELGIPVVNLGIDGPVGLDVILPSVIEQVKPGDTVLLIPEYLILLDEDGLGDRSTSFGIAVGKPGLGGIPLKMFLQDVIALGIPSLRAVAKSAVDAATQGELKGYYSDPVSDKGDPTTVKERQQEWWKLKIGQPISQHSVTRIARFKEEVEARGGKLVLSLPWVYANRERKTFKNVKLTAYYLSKIAPTIYDRESFNIQDNVDYFADTHYHLLPEGRKARAEQLVKELKPIVN